MHKSAVRSYAGPVSFVVGPEKTATTFVQLLLEQHPDAALPVGTKETFFFDRFYDNGMAWYLDRFRPAGERRHLVEVGAGYFASDQALERIRRHFPRARIAICARDPVERAISHYNHERRYGYLRGPLHEAMGLEDDHIRPSLYSRYCPRWEAAFGADRVTVLDTNLLETDPVAFAAATYRAVGLRPMAVDAGIVGQRVYEGAPPRSFLLARLATGIANRFKRHGWYRVLERVRGTRLHRMIYGRPGAAMPAVEPEVQARLELMLDEERQFLADRYGIGANRAQSTHGEPAGAASAS